jgi:hypothetical protein
MSQPVEILYAVPVGTVIAWYPVPPNASLPPGFAYCNGELISDPDSPFNTMYAPDLTSRFILGAGGPVTANQQGGSTDYNLQGWETGNIDTGPTQVSMSQDNVQNNVIARNQSSASYRYSLSQKNEGWQDGNHHHQIASISVPAPGWVALVYIIRIK